MNRREIRLKDKTKQEKENCVELLQMGWGISRTSGSRGCQYAGRRRNAKRVPSEHLLGKKKGEGGGRQHL